MNAATSIGKQLRVLGIINLSTQLIRVPKAVAGAGELMMEVVNEIIDVSLR